MSEQPVLQSVTISVAPRVEVSKYHAFKPHASVTIGIPPGGLKDEHLAFAAEALRKAIFKSLQLEIEVVNDAVSVLGETGNTDKLAAYCMKEIGDVTQHPTFKVASAGSGAGSQGSGGVSAKAQGQEGGSKVAVKKPVVKIPASSLFGKPGVPVKFPKLAVHKGAAADIG